MLLEVCVHILESLYTDIGVIYSIRFCDCPMILEVVPLTNRAVIGDSDYKIRTEKTNRKRNTNTGIAVIFAGKHPVGVNVPDPSCHCAA